MNMKKDVTNKFNCCENKKIKYYCKYCERNYGGKPKKYDYDLYIYKHKRCGRHSD